MKSASAVPSCVAGLLLAMGGSLLLAAGPQGSSAPPPAGGTTAPPTAPAAPPAAPPPSAPAQPAAPAAPTAPAPGGRAAAPGPQNVHPIALKDLTGKDVPLSTYAGKPMVLEVWATWCGPCRKQRELMLKLAPEFKDKVIFAAASTDDDVAKVTQFLKGKPGNPALLEFMATPAFMAALRTRDPSNNTIPKVVYINSRGAITDVGTGTQSETWMRAMLKTLR